MNSKEKFGMEDMKKLIVDDYFDSADFMLNTFFESNPLFDSEIEKTSFEILKTWNRKGELESIGASIFSEYRIQLARDIFLDEMGEDIFKELATSARMDHFLRRIFPNQNSAWWDNINTAEKEDRSMMLKKSFQHAIATLAGKLGNNPKEWQWKKIHTLTLNHPLGKIPLIGKFFNSGPRAVNGGSETINNQRTFLHRNSHEVESGPSMRTILDFARLDEIHLINPLGQSGHRLSPYFDNQADMYSKGEFRKMNFYEMRETDSKKILHFLPE